MKVGSRYRSKSTTVEIIVVKGGGPDATLSCAGEEMVPFTAGQKAEPRDNPPDAPAEDKLLVGKRYLSAELGVEVLCTTAGVGPVAVNGQRLTQAEAKLLPSSD